MIETEHETHEFLYWIDSLVHHSYTENMDLYQAYGALVFAHSITLSSMAITASSDDDETEGRAKSSTAKPSSVAAPTVSTDLRCE